MSGGKIWVSPTEPPAIRIIGDVSPLPERYGCDVLWVSERLGGLAGVQRKEIGDLVASVQDGRLAKEMGQMTPLVAKVLVVEGRPRWSTDGVLMLDSWTRWDKASHRSLLRSVQNKGVWIEMTEDPADTVGAVLGLKKWLEKERHTALDSRPKPKGPWGTASDRDWSLHLLQSFAGIGPVQAAAILDHFGKVPLRWEVTVAELLEVKGIGKVRAEGLIAALEQPVEKPVEKKNAGNSGKRKGVA